jgi:hypothetical protein
VAWRGAVARRSLCHVVICDYCCVLVQA